MQSFPLLCMIINSGGAHFIQVLQEITEYTLISYYKLCSQSFPDMSGETVEEEKENEERGDS